MMYIVILLLAIVAIIATPTTIYAADTEVLKEAEDMCEHYYYAEWNVDNNKCILWDEQEEHDFLDDVANVEDGMCESDGAEDHEALCEDNDIFRNNGKD